MEDFVREVRRHSVNHWKNPAGFLRDLAKKFRSRTLKASAPVTEAEAKARDYKCSECGSTKPGEGLVLQEGREVPCVCASAEYIARMRDRGVVGAGRKRPNQMAC